MRDILRGGRDEFGLDDGGGLMGRLRVCGRPGWGFVAELVLLVSEEGAVDGFVPDETLVLGLSPAHVRRASRSIS